MRLLAASIYAAGAALYLLPFFQGSETNGITDHIWAIPYSAGIVAIGLITDHFAAARKLRPVWALRLMMLISGMLLLCGIALPRLCDPDYPSAAAIIGGWAGFMSLWWIATLLFDLAYCWQRFINVSYDWLSRVREVAKRTSKI